MVSLQRAQAILLLVGWIALPALAADGSSAPNLARPAEVLHYQLINSYPHDRAAFTQGLIIRDGFLFESTGLNGRSSLRKVVLKTGEVVQRETVDTQYFAEGLVDWGDELIQLTWQSKTGFVYDAKTFKQKRTFSYTGEGWGITHDGKRLIMSDGTSKLRFLDPKTFSEIGQLDVRFEGKPLPNLNELEFVKGEIYANVWGNNNLVMIDPKSGQVTARVDLSALWQEFDRTGADVLNGIAYDAKNDRLYVTGKNWPKLFEIRIEKADLKSKANK
jgi:glutaminyl-peptide cyclotransferase